MAQTEQQHEQRHNDAPADECLTVHDVAREQKASVRSIYRAIQRGQLRAARINDRGDLRTYRSWVREWMRSRARLAE